MKKLIVLILLMFQMVLGYSTPLLIDTVPQNDILVQITYSRLVKATKGLIELEHRKFQLGQAEEMIKEKDRVIRDLLKANTLSHKINVQYQEKEVALNQKAIEYEKLSEVYKSEIKKAKKQGMWLKLGTPFLALSVGLVSSVSGYYICKLTR